MPELTPTSSIRLLIRANHILHSHALVDAFGHISLRNPSNPSTYLLAAYDPGAPALVKSRADFITYAVADSTPVSVVGAEAGASAGAVTAPQGYAERYIHGELLARIPEAQCVVHSHSEAVIPFSASGVKVRAVFHMAGFLGAGEVAVFDAGVFYDAAEEEEKEGEKETGGKRGRDMLVKDQRIGQALAACFDGGARTVVLQHKHGFTTWGRSVEEAVYRAVYTQVNCRLMKSAVELAGGRADGVVGLTEEEAEACRVMNERTLDKSFRLWLREVQVNPLYETEEGEPEPPAVKGLKV